MDGIYKKNIETEECEVISKDSGGYMNIYDDYLYYTTWMAGIDPEYQVVRMKKDGTNREVIADKVYTKNMQIIDNTLYYISYIGDIGENYDYNLTEIYLTSIDLETQEKTEILKIKDVKSSILIKNPDNTIDMYIEIGRASCRERV